MTAPYFASSLPLHEVAELQRLMIEEIREVAVFFMNPDGVITVWNRGAEDMKGYTAEDALGSHLSLLYTDQDKARQWPEHNLKAAAERGFYKEETWRQKKDGNLFWARISLTALHSQEGKLVGFSKVTVDLTHHRMLESCLKEKEETNRILRAADAGTWKWNPESDEVEVSPDFLDLLGRTRTIQRYPLPDWIDLVHPDDRSVATSKIFSLRHRVLNTSVATELRVCKSDGGYRWFYVRAEWSPENGDGPLMLMGVNVDINDLKTAEEERARLFQQLRAERVRLSEILDQMPSGVILAELPSGKAVYQNQAAESMLAASVHDKEGARSLDQCHFVREYSERAPAEDTSLIHLLTHAATENKPVRGEEVTYKRPDGGRSHFVFTASAIVDSDHVSRIAVAVLHDIGALKQTRHSLASERERAQITLSAIADGVITTDPHGKVLSVNPAAERLTGWSEAEAKGEPVGNVFHAIDESMLTLAANPVQRCLEECCTVYSSARAMLINKDGTRFSVESSAAPIRLPDDSVIGAVLVFHDVTESRQLLHKLGFQAAHDALTGLVNRREFELRLKRTLAHAKQSDSAHSALLYMDLDQFKIVNDTCGHPAGDELLEQLAQVYREHVRERDTLARIGGDEFALIVEHCTLDEAVSVAEKILQTTRNFRYSCKEHLFRVGVSIGVVPITGQSLTAETAMRQADHACYLAKEAGRNRIFVQRNGNTDIADRRNDMHWVTRLNDAFHNNKLQLYYQPIVPVEPDSGGLHYEILLRLINGNKEVISPSSFLPAAERYDVMPSIDRWVLRRSLEWLEQNAEHVAALDMCTINLSRRTLADESFQKYAKELFDATTVPAEKICFEITENGAIANMRKTISFINSLAERGCKFSLDDFGSGMTSFAYLKQLPVDFIKIDGAFIQMMSASEVDYEMVRFTNDISHMMGRRTIAEYVTSESILTQLRDIGVDFAQGYWVGKPQFLAA